LALARPERNPRRSEDGKTNLLIVASSLWIGGAETVIRNLALSVDRSRFNVTVCCLKQRGTVGDDLAAAGVEVVCLPGAGGKGVDYFTFRKLLRVIRERRIDVVHTHTAHGLVDATLCKMFVRRLKVVHTFHFGNYPHTKPRIIWMERVFSRGADRLFAVGQVQRRQIRDVHHLPERRVGVILNGVTPPAKGTPEFRAKLKTGSRILIGTIATLIKQKGLSDLMRVAARVRELGYDVQFVVAGEGKLRPELEVERHALGVDDMVLLPGWVTDAADVALPAFDIFFQPSLWEAMSVVILEAMAAGKAIVATRVGETPHIIEDGVDGLLVNPGDVDGMASALVRLIADADLRRRLGDTAKRKVNERFTVEHMTHAYEQAYLATQQ
jgi:glycosyltransferase involved in cell wall biosynthesis